MTTQDEPLTRNQLAGNIRAGALRVFWFNAKPDLPQALVEAQKLLKAVATYGEMLAGELAEETEGGPPCKNQ
jgi:hypothetical protein